MILGVFSSAYKSLRQSLADSIHIFEILDRIPKIPLNVGAIIENFQGRIEFQNVNFHVIIIILILVV